MLRRRGRRRLFGCLQFALQKLEATLYFRGILTLVFTHRFKQSGREVGLDQIDAKAQNGDAVSLDLRIGMGQHLHQEVVIKGALFECLLGLTTAGREEGADSLVVVKRTLLARLVHDDG